MRRTMVLLLAGLAAGAVAVPVLAQTPGIDHEDSRRANVDHDDFRRAYVATRLSFGGAREVITSGEQVEVNLDADVLFALDSSELSDEATALLERTAEELADAAEGTVLIVGHTDDQGAHDYNQRLSEDRAEAVAAALAPALEGTELELHTEGRADDEPAVEGTSEEARAANRRVQITYERS